MRGPRTDGELERDAEDLDAARVARLDAPLDALQRDDLHAVTHPRRVHRHVHPRLRAQVSGGEREQFDTEVC